MNLRKVPLAVLVCCYSILWLGVVVSHLLHGRTPEGAGWATSAFLTLAGLIVLHRRMLLTVGTLGIVIEAISIHFGIPFGRYECVFR